jgi:hypothetical protein
LKQQIMGASAEAYSEAISGAQKALDRFERHGHGTFLWQAYTQARSALLAFPSYRQDLVIALRRRQPEWNVTEDRITDTVARELMERILSHIDTMAKDLLAVRGTSSQAGSVNLRTALHMQDDLSPLQAQGRETEERIFEEFLDQIADLSINQKQFGHKAPPANAITWNFTRVRNNVARAVGVSGKHAGEIIHRWLASNPDQKKLMDEVLTTARTLKPKKPAKTKTATRKKKRCPAKPAAWRR